LISIAEWLRVYTWRKTKFTSLALSTLLLAYPAPRDVEPPDKGPGYLGVTFEGAEADGVLITDVRTDGPAISAGLRAQDIIRKFNGEPIQFDTFAKRIIRIRPGTVVPLDIQRGSANLVIKVKIGVRPDDFPYPLPEPEDQSIPPQNDQPDLPAPPKE
jgi:predicted metalloprotease with PDZ domain